METKIVLTCISLIIWLVCRVGCGATRRCFECHHASTPQGCGNITICNSDEYCYIEQFVTSTGNIVFDSGCISQSQCSGSTRPAHLIGKRAKYMIGNRKRDISICKECCSDEYCNMRGCGVPETPPEKRAPYCFYCDAMQDPSACRRVLLCSQGELCGVYTTDYNGSHHNQHNGTVRSTCVKQSTCDTLMQTNVDQKCGAKCCRKDFCNDQCGAVQNGSMTSQVPNTQSTSAVQGVVTLKGANMTAMSQDTTPSVTTVHGNVSSNGSTLPYTRYGHHEHTTTTSTPQSSTTSEPGFHCDPRGDYIHLHAWHAQLCVRFEHIQVATWQQARMLCQQHGAHLVILDTHAKAELLRNELAANSDYDLYWIGAADFSGHDHFKWLNGQYVRTPEADWGSGQPDNVVHGYNEDCVAMERSDHTSQSFRWHDRICSYQVNYICER